MLYEHGEWEEVLKGSVWKNGEWTVRAEGDDMFSIDKDSFFVVAVRGFWAAMLTVDTIA